MYKYTYVYCVFVLYNLNTVRLFKLLCFLQDDAEDSDNIHNDLYGDDNEQDDDVDRANRSQIDAAFLYDEVCCYDSFFLLLVLKFN